MKETISIGLGQGQELLNFLELMRVNRFDTKMGLGRAYDVFELRQEGSQVIVTLNCHFNCEFVSNFETEFYPCFHSIHYNFGHDIIFFVQMYYVCAIH